MAEGALDDLIQLATFAGGRKKTIPSEKRNTA
jgi:hypothetical protein